MTSSSLTVTEVVRHISDYISRVAYRHESFVLCKGKRAVAELRPVPRGRCLGDLPGILRSLPRLSSADAVDFGRDVDTARDALKVSEVRDPWAS